MTGSSGNIRWPTSAEPVEGERPVEIADSEDDVVETIKAERSLDGTLLLRLTPQLLRLAAASR